MKLVYTAQALRSLEEVLEFIDPEVSLLILLWAIIYRPIVDGIRLIKKGIINKNEFVKLFIPVWRRKWFKELYFE
jgi:hypothetical protein